MHRRFLSLLVLLTAATVAQAQSLAPRTAQFPPTTDDIHLEMVFNYDLTKATLHRETGVVDLVWGSRWPGLPAGMYNSYYVPFAVDNYANPVAWYQAHHPDWLEYQCDRQTLAFEFGNTALAPLNFADAQVRAYQWRHWVDAKLAAGYRGIAVDNMDLTNDWQQCGHYNRAGTWVQQFSGKSADPAYRRAVLAWEAATYQHVHGQSATATMQVNVSYSFGAPLADNQQLMTTADLVLDERGFTNWGSAPNWPTPAEWQTIVTQAKHIQAKGVCYMTNGEEPGLTGKISRKERLWIIGNYLLIKENCTYMYISGYTAEGAQDYGRLITFPEYDIAIGHPTGPMQKTQGVWARWFSNGLVLVNPSTTSVSGDLPPGSWVDVDGNAVAPQLTLGPQTAQVLLTKP